VEEKDRVLSECQCKVTELTEERDRLVTESNSTKRYLEALPTADEHTANIRQV